MVSDPQRRNGEELVPEDDAVIGTSVRWSLLALALLLVIVAAVLWLMREEPAEEVIVERGPVVVPAPLVQDTPEMPSVAFTDITKQAGITFRHENGARGDKLLPETMGGGVAFLDYDGDGDQDLLFVNSRPWPEDDALGGTTMALYRNDGRGGFDDVTAGSGLDVSLYGQGVAVGDYDGDGDRDLFLSAVGPNHLFANEGGRFRDVTARAAVSGGATDWSTSSGFFDYDNDGDLDLFVCNYVEWSRDIDLRLNFTLNGEDRAYGPPKEYRGTHSLLYRNEGDGTFRDVSEEAGIRVTNPATGQPMGKALAVTFVDTDRDGYLDIFVSNDTVQNFLFHNQGGTGFEEMGILSGVGLDNNGNATGAMGLDAAHLTDDDRLGIAIANFANEHTSLYKQQDGPLLFVDTANADGVGSPSRLHLSFGLFFFDYDLDGRLDLLQANGHLENEINEIQPSQHYRQKPQVFWNCSTPTRTCFAALPEDRLGGLDKSLVGRGAAYGDIDGDGDLDVAIAENGGSPLLARNDQRLGHHWLRVRLAGNGPNPDAIGAEVELRAGGLRQRRLVMPTRSYLSQVELPLTFGIGPEERVDALTVRWPDGHTQEVPVASVDTTLVIRR
jgi:hypothetical protein